MTSVRRLALALPLLLASAPLAACDDADGSSDSGGPSDTETGGADTDVDPLADCPSERIISACSGEDEYCIPEYDADECVACLEDRCSEEREACLDAFPDSLWCGERGSLVLTCWDAEFVETEANAAFCLEQECAAVCPEHPDPNPPV